MTQRLLEKISSVYEKAYNTPNNNNIFEKLPKDNIRMFIKAAVEAFDLIRFHPHKKIEELLR